MDVMGQMPHFRRQRNRTVSEGARDFFDARATYKQW